MTFADRLEELRKAATKGRWYLLESPWLQSGMKTAILAKSPDPHVAEFVCDFEFFGDNGDDEEDKSWDNAEYIRFLANNADAILELVRAAEEIPEILRNWEPDHSSGLERKKIVAFQSALAKLNGEQT